MLGVTENPALTTASVFGGQDGVFLFLQHFRSRSRLQLMQNFHLVLRPDIFHIVQSLEDSGVDGCSARMQDIRPKATFKSDE